MPIRLGLLGEEIAHSQSPQLFEALFAEAGLEGSFELIPTKPSELATRFRELKERGIAGLAVTIPFKQRMTELVESLAAPADEIGAVNGVSFAGGTAVGYNTDAAGFAAPLRYHREQLQGGMALVLGAGGAAAAVIYALTREFGLKEIVVAGRSVERVEAFARKWAGASGRKVTATQLSQLEAVDCSDCAMIVNCTPLGGPAMPERLPLTDRFVWPSGAIYYDLNYNGDNLAVQVAREVGVEAIDGARMLAAQAAGLFGIWTGREVAWEGIFERVFGARASR